MGTESTDESLRREVEFLRRQLAEAQETIRAIHGGEVDAVIVDAAEQPKVFTIDSADRPYRLLVEQFEQAAATLTTDGCILSCNEPFAEMLACPAADLRGRRLQEFVEAPDLQRAETLLRRALAGRTEDELMFRRGDAARTSRCVEIRPLHEGVAGVCLVLADITEQKRRERLIADEALARSILEQVVDAVVVCDRNGVVLRASRAAHDLSGGNPIGRRFEDMFGLTRLPADGVRAAPVDMRPAWRGETLRGWEVEFARPDGQRAELLLGAGPLVAASGEVLGSIITLTDITALREAKNELRRRASELQEADRRKDEFLATLAHELRNPLSPIRSALEIMQLKELDDPYLRKCHEVIGRQTQQLTRLVDDLLEVSRIRSGKIQLQRERIDLGTAVARAVETSRPVVDVRRHRLTVAIPNAPMWVHADLMRLSQVISNLIHNAAKYTEEGGEIHVQAAREGAEAVIRVRDTGIGIPREMLSKVFELFTQVSQSIDRSHGGLGIGLALVKRLVTLHGGRVEAHSEGPGRGSEFIVRLPLAGESEGRAGVPSDGRSDTGEPSRRVLVVDDNHDAAETLSVLLGMLGHEVRTAADGPTALATAAEFRPDVVLCDIGLPLMDGYEVVSRLRTRPEFASTYFVALSGYGREEDIQRSFAAGFQDHIVKPLDLARLEATLSRSE